MSDLVFLPGSPVEQPAVAQHHSQASSSSSASSTGEVTTPTWEVSRTRFSERDEILLFREVLAQEFPFARGSKAWETVSANLRATGKDFSARLCWDKVRAAVAMATVHVEVASDC